ncbi:uncharacterized protein LOC114306321 [Camellia sinensis]|uniref:uncharacterized protein LOC114306321 n=1 Tax=Camellia sinensis TaxID=4442 RepID=UPI0010365FA3|nr:uncharacterized protein LOC114306321 [Camellia sinensis]
MRNRFKHQRLYLSLPSPSQVFISFLSLSFQFLNSLSLPSSEPIPCDADDHRHHRPPPLLSPSSFVSLPLQGSQGKDKRVLFDNNDLVLHEGFLEINSFGHSFRDYDAKSERQQTVEEFYRVNHINQTYDFVHKGRIRGFFLITMTWFCMKDFQFQNLCKILGLMPQRSIHLATHLGTMMQRVKDNKLLRNSIE